MSVSVKDFESRLTERSRPDRVALNCLFELTPTCNLRCHFCYVALEPYKGPYLSTAQVCTILDKIADAGVLWLTLTGGEIFSRRDFPEIYRYAKSKGFLVSLYSNATMVTEEIADLLRELPPLSVEVSIYGADAEHYEATTGIKGAFARFVRGIDLLQSAGVSLVLKTPISVMSVDQIDRLRAFASARGVPFHIDPAVDATHDPEHRNHDKPTLYRIESKKAAQLIRDALPSEVTDTLVARSGAVGPLPECVRPDSTNDNELYQCNAGRTGFFIDGLGQVSHCVIDRQPSFPLLEMEWDDVWARIGEWVTQPLPTDAPCHGCDMRSSCSNCPARSRLATGSPYLKDTYFCDVTHHVWGLEPETHPDYRLLASKRPLGACAR